MKSLQTPLLLAIMGVLVWLASRNGCGTETREPLTDAEVSGMIAKSLDSALASKLTVVQSDISQLERVMLDRLNGISGEQRTAIKRMLDTEHRVRQSGGELQGFINFGTETIAGWKSRAHVTDTMYLGMERKMAVSRFSDDWMNGYVLYDLERDSVTTGINLRNEFDLVQSKDGEGNQSVEIVNLNPYTYTLPGGSVFRLDKPPDIVPKHQPRVSFGLQAGLYVGKSGQIRPGAGVGVQYRLLTFGKKE